MTTSQYPTPPSIVYLGDPQGSVAPGDLVICRGKYVPVLRVCTIPPGDNRGIPVKHWTQEEPRDYSATNSNGERIDLRELTNDQLRAYRDDAAAHGDDVCVATIDELLRGHDGH